MGALAAHFAALPPPQRTPIWRSSLVRLGALGRSYFSATVAAKGWPSAYDDLIAASAAAAGVDSNLIRAIISAESGWDPGACSTSSCGLMQINYAVHGLTRAQVLDPSFNVSYGARVIGEQVARRPNVQLALAAYNAGTGRSDSDLSDRIARDVNGVGTYVQTVLDYLNYFQAQSYAQPTEPDAAPTPSADLPSGATWIDATAAETVSALEPWQWWALGGAAALGVVLLVLVTRRRRRMAA